VGEAQGEVGRDEQQMQQVVGSHLVVGVTIGDNPP
jgi:hypothetical protein